MKQIVSVAQLIEQILYQRGPFHAIIQMNTAVGRSNYIDTITGLETHYDSDGKREIYVILKYDKTQLRTSMISQLEA